MQVPGTCNLLKTKNLRGDVNIVLLIDQIKKSNEAAEYKLFRQYFPYIKSICIRYGANEDEVQEMVNDTFLKIFRHIEKYDPEFEFKPWIRKICINCCLTYNKKYFTEQIKVSLDNIREFETDKNYENIADSLSPNECLQLLNKLSPQYRTVFNLFVFEDMKHHEIAGELNISVGTSKSNLNRAKSQLLEIIKSEKPHLFNNKIVLNG